MSVLHLLGSAADGGAETYFASLVGALESIQRSKARFSGQAISPDPIVL